MRKPKMTCLHDSQGSEPHPRHAAAPVQKRLQPPGQTLMYIFLNWSWIQAALLLQIEDQLINYMNMKVPIKDMTVTSVEKRS